MDEGMCKQIIETIMDNGPGVKWGDISGLQDVKQLLLENIIYP